MVFNFTTVGKYVSLEEALNTYSRLPITSHALPLWSCFKTWCRLVTRIYCCLALSIRKL